MMKFTVCLRIRLFSTSCNSYDSSALTSARPPPPISPPPPPSPAPPAPIELIEGYKLCEYRRVNGRLMVVQQTVKQVVNIDNSQDTAVDRNVQLIAMKSHMQPKQLVRMPEMLVNDSQMVVKMLLHSPEMVVDES